MYDVVRLVSAPSATGVPFGTLGTVVMVHDHVPPAYEVEFMANDTSLGTFTVTEEELALEWTSERRDRWAS